MVVLKCLNFCVMNDFTRFQRILSLTTKCGGGWVWTPPSKIMLRWAFWIIFFLNLWKNRNSLPDFSADFCAVQLRDISKKHFFLRYHPLLWLCNSAHTCSKFFFSVGFLVRVHIFILVQVWGQYLFSTLSYGFFKNDTLLHCCSGPKWTEKQDLLFTKIALTWCTN